MDKKINLDEYICYDGPLPVDPRIENMTREEIEIEFHKLFGQYLNKNDLI